MGCPPLSAVEKVGDLPKLFGSRDVAAVDVKMITGCWL